MTHSLSASLEAVLAASRTCQAEHAAALRWQPGLGVAAAVAWLPASWAADAPPGVLRLLPPALLSQQRESSQRRWVAAATDHLLASAACAALTGAAGAAVAADFVLRRDAMGRPELTPGPELARLLPTPAVHVSFSHDGGAHVCLLAAEPALAGLGIDVVWLPRLARRRGDAGYLRRLAARFMAPAVLDAHQRFCASADAAAAERDLAMRFGLMEAGSKALGVGLRLGAGIGRPGSLPPRALGALGVSPGVSWLLGREATARLRALGACRLEGHAAADPEYVVSVAAAMRG